MGATDFAESRFRENLKAERDERKWSQAHVAKLLFDKGIAVYPTTIAKMESGERAARIDEVVAVADLFDVSVDTLLGRSSRRHRSGDKQLAFSALARLLQHVVGQTESMEATLRDRLADLDSLNLRKDELAARDECQRATSSVADTVTALRKAGGRVVRIQQRMVSEFLSDDSHDDEEGNE
jgi:transcriptional regulator with XRE-family HTH domain